MGEIVWTLKVSASPELEFELGELDAIDQALQRVLASLLKRETGLVIIDCGHRLEGGPPA